MESFSALLESARDGSRRAQEEIYCRYAERVTRAIRRRFAPALRRRFDTLDLTHSVFTDVLGNLDQVRDHGEGAFRHWLYLKAENKLRDKLRKHLGPGGRRAEVPLLPEDEPLAREPSPVIRAESKEEAGCARDLLDSLAPSLRRLARLRLEEGRSFGEIADLLGLASPDAARKRFSRLLSALRSSCATEV
jgi:RNA polymerase sigma factor (sigma-70 family)